MGESQGLMSRVAQQPLWLLVAAIMFVPTVLPLLMIGLPVILVGVATLYYLSPQKQVPADAAAVSASDLAPAAATVTEAAPEQAVAAETPQQTVLATSEETYSQPTPLTGSAAILARMRADRAQPAAPKNRNVVVLFASQTGTAEEIAKNIAAEASSLGLQAKVRNGEVKAWSRGCRPRYGAHMY